MFSKQNIHSLSSSLNHSSASRNHFFCPFSAEPISFGSSRSIFQHREHKFFFRL
jgi:hypothetical protein